MIREPTQLQINNLHPRDMILISKQKYTFFNKLLDKILGIQPIYVNYKR